uniref:Uncharacterized protein n=1 Tax=Oryza nivara TaxID=4536 RepID=A0A0E0J1F4_ORYNI
MGPLVNLSLSLFIFFLSFSVLLFLSLSRHTFFRQASFFSRRRKRPRPPASSPPAGARSGAPPEPSTSPSGLIHRGNDDFSLHDAFVCSAHAALADVFLHRDPQDWERKHDVVAGVVSHPVARRVEELRVAAVKSADEPSSDKEVAEMEGEFHLSLRSNTQPSETLHVLDVTGYGSFSLSAGGAPAADDAAAAAVRRAGQGPAGRRRLRAGARHRAPRVRLPRRGERRWLRPRPPGQCTTSACVGR